MWKSTRDPEAINIKDVAQRLARGKDRILTEWERLAREQVPAASSQPHLALLDSLPKVIDEMVTALSRTELDLTFQKEEIRLAREHGEERAASPEYSLDQVIWEYHLLRRVIFRVLEEEGSLSSSARDTIWDAIFVAIRNSASEFVHNREQRNRADFVALVDNVYDYAIFLLDAEGHVRTWNAGAERMKGYKAEEVVGKHYRMLYLPEDREKKRPEHNLRKAAEQGHTDDEGLRLRKDGTTFWASVNITRISEPDGRLRGFAKVVRDLTARKAMEDELRAAVRSRDEFLSICSHELKAPLTSLLLQLEMMSREAGPDGLPSRDQYVRRSKTFRKQIHRLSHLVDDMLEVSQRQGTELPLRRGVFDYGELLQEVQEQFCSEEPYGKCSIQLDSTPGILIEADRDRIIQVVTNLLVNALKYGQGKGVKIVLRAEKSLARLTVRDEGIGISKEHQERIFQKFERVASSENVGGMGVGLYLAKKIITAHLGEIRVESEAGCGSTFIVDLPLKVAGDPVPVECRDP